VTRPVLYTSSWDEDEPTALANSGLADDEDALTQPCKSCGKDNSVRSFGLMCEACQRTTKFSVDGKQLTAHIEEQQRRADAHIKRMEKENEFQVARQKAANEEYKAWLKEYDTERVRAAHAREDAWREEAERRSEARVAKDQLHRLYTAWLACEWAKPGFDASQGGVLRDAMTFARSAQEFFEKENRPMLTLSAPVDPGVESRRDAITAEIEKIAALKTETAG
jgi:hypothetical protein